MNLGSKVRVGVGVRGWCLIDRKHLPLSLLLSSIRDIGLRDSHCGCREYSTREFVPKCCPKFVPIGACMQLDCFVYPKGQLA